MKSYINYIHTTLGSEKITNKDLASIYTDYSEAEIVRTTGVEVRYKSNFELTSDFATHCANEFFEKFDIEKSDIDYLIYCTEGPDYIAPATSCIIQNKLKLPNNIGTLDLSFGCSGYTYSLLQAKALLESGIAKNILLITADFPRHVIRKKDAYLNFIFSDAASCSLISSNKVGFEIKNFDFGTDGQGEKKLTVENSGFKNPKNKEWYSNIENEDLSVGKMTMDGESVFKFTIKKVPDHINLILKKNKITFDEIDLFIFHQPSKIILKSLKRKLKIHDDNFYCNLAMVGNTVSASIPLALCHALEEKKIKSEMNILISGFGIGFSWSGTILKS